MTAREAKRRLETLVGVMETAMVEAIDDTKDEYIALQQDQFREGKKRDGVQMVYWADPAEAYSPGYKKKRQRHGLQTEVKDLNFTSEYYGQMEMEADAESIRITSGVEYEKWIDHFYNEDGELYGLSDENLDQYRRAAFWPVMREKITEESQLNFG